MSEEKRVIYRNTFTPTAEHYKQAFRNQLFGGSNLQPIVLFAALGVLLVLTGIQVLMKGGVSGDNTSFLLIMDVVLVCLMLVLYFWMPAYFAKTTIRRLAEGYQGPVRLQMDFLEDTVHFQNEASGGEMNLQYDIFLRGSESKDLLLLQTRSKQTLLLLKDGFEPADAAGFKTFMQARCPQAKFNWKKVS